MIGSVRQEKQEQKWGLCAEVSVTDADEVPKLNESWGNPRAVGSVAFSRRQGSIWRTTPFAGDSSIARRRDVSSNTARLRQPRYPLRHAAEVFASLTSQLPICLGLAFKICFSAKQNHLPRAARVAWAISTRLSRQLHCVLDSR